MEVNMKQYVIIFQGEQGKNHIRITCEGFNHALKVARLFCRNTNNDLIGLVEAENFIL